MDFLLRILLRLLTARRRIVAGPNKRTESVFCPFCNAKGNQQPVLSPMGVLFVECGRPATVQPFAAAHFTFVCPRCGFGEIHERLIDSTYR